MTPSVFLFANFTTPEVVLIVLIYAVILIGNFLPTILGRKRPNVFIIFLINLFLGWTIIGWFYALYLATKKPSAPSVAQAPEQHL
jgi:hypothetical protein